jgi:hypothetical protein
METSCSQDDISIGKARAARVLYCGKTKYLDQRVRLGVNFTNSKRSNPQLVERYHSDTPSIDRVV